MDWRDKDAIKDIWEEGWAFGSHGSSVSFDEWYAEKFSKQIARDARRNKCALLTNKQNLH